MSRLYSICYSFVYGWALFELFKIASVVSVTNSFFCIISGLAVTMTGILLYLAVILTTDPFVCLIDEKSEANDVNHVSSISIKITEGLYASISSFSIIMHSGVCNLVILIPGLFPCSVISRPRGHRSTLMGSSCTCLRTDLQCSSTRYGRPI